MFCSEGLLTKITVVERPSLQSNRKTVQTVFFFSNLLTSVQDDLFGARLASKYLDKELAGRIQQIQLLGRDIRGDEYEQVWNQLEAEIHLHRHKTVIRACRQNLVSFAFFENISFFRTNSNGEYIPVM